MYKFKRALLHGLVIAACAVVPLGMGALTAYDHSGRDDVKVEKTRFGGGVGIYYGRPYYGRPYYYRPYYRHYYRPYYRYYYGPYYYGYRVW